MKLWWLRRFLWTLILRRMNSDYSGHLRKGYVLPFQISELTVCTLVPREFGSANSETGGYTTDAKTRLRQHGFTPFVDLPLNSQETSNYNIPTMFLISKCSLIAVRSLKPIHWAQHCLGATAPYFRPVMPRLSWVKFHDWNAVKCSGKSMGSRVQLPGFRVPFSVFQLYNLFKPQLPIL
jgi:hypothetical protein